MKAFLTRMSSFARSSLAWGIAAVLFAGCAAAQNSLAQEMAWERWKKCDRFPTVTLKEIRTDGQIWVWTHHGTDLAAWRECDTAAKAEQASRRVAVSSSVSGPPAAHPGASAFAAAPTLKRGSEWAYRWESPQGKGTFVYVLDREETRDGAAWYVVKSGARELHFRKHDLAISLDVVDGQTEIRRSPATELLKWPLTAGQEWEQAYTVERPKDRSTTEIKAVCKTEREEMVTVPAGSFQTFKSVCHNKLTGAMLFELWYSPQAAAFVRERATFPYGVRERELIEYRLR